MNDENKQTELTDEWARRLRGGGIKELRLYAAFLDSLLAAKAAQKELDSGEEKVL